MDKDDIIKRIAGLLNESGEPPSIFHDKDTFGDVPSSQGSLLAYLLKDWDFTRPAQELLVALERLCTTYPIDADLEIGCKEEIIQNYKIWQTNVDMRPGNSQNFNEGPSLYT